MYPLVICLPVYCAISDLRTWSMVKVCCTAEINSAKAFITLLHLCCETPIDSKNAGTLCACLESNCIVTEPPCLRRRLQLRVWLCSTGFPGPASIVTSFSSEAKIAPTSCGDDVRTETPLMLNSSCPTRRPEPTKMLVGLMFVTTSLPRELFAKLTPTLLLGDGLLLVAMVTVVILYWLCLCYLLLLFLCSCVEFYDVTINSDFETHCLAPNPPSNQLLVQELGLPLQPAYMWYLRWARSERSSRTLLVLSCFPNPRLGKRLALGALAPRKCAA